MRNRRAWVMPEEEVRTLLGRIEEKIRSSQIRVPDRDRLIRFRAMLEEDLGQQAPVLVVNANAETQAEGG
jgi:hypothetical protein